MSLRRDQQLRQLLLFLFLLGCISSCLARRQQPLIKIVGTATGAESQGSSHDRVANTQAENDDEQLQRMIKTNSLLRMGESGPKEDAEMAVDNHHNKKGKQWKVKNKTWKSSNQL